VACANILLADANFVCVSVHCIVGSFPAHDLALVLTPSLCEVLQFICGAAPGEITPHGLAIQILSVLSNAQGRQEAIILVCTGSRLLVSSAGATISLINDLHCRSEARSMAGSKIRSIGHEEACHNVVSAWLSFLWNHEPEKSAGETKVAIVRDVVRVAQQLVRTIVALIEDLAEGSVLLVPLEGDRAASEEQRRCWRGHTGSFEATGCLVNAVLASWILQLTKSSRLLEHVSAESG